MNTDAGLGLLWFANMNKIYIKGCKWGDDRQSEGSWDDQVFLELWVKD